MKKILLFSFGALLTLLCLDFYISFAEIITPNATYFDSEVGVLTKKNRNLTVFNEGFFLGRTNNYGYWGPGYAPQKVAGTIRIALIGDSYIEGFQMFDRNHLRTIIEQELTKKLQKKVEVLKFGFSGFNLENMYYYYEAYIKKFHPDFTLFFVKNPDIYNLNIEYNLPNVLVDSLHKTITLNTKFSDNEKFRREKALQRFSGISSILQLAHNDLTLIKSGELLPILLDKFYPQKKNREDGNINMTHELSLKAKLIFKSLGKEKGIGIVNLKEIDKQILTEINLNNLYYFDPIATLSTQQKKDFVYWKATHTTGHWNQIAHRYIGKFLADRLAPILKNLNFN